MDLLVHHRQTMLGHRWITILWQPEHLYLTRAYNQDQSTPSATTGQPVYCNQDTLARLEPQEK